MENDVDVSEFTLFEETKKQVLETPLENEKNSTSEPPQENIEVDDEEELSIEDVNLKSINVERIVGTANLTPIVLYMKVKEDDEPIGVFGFYDAENKIFVNLDGSPVEANGFEKAWKEFLENRRAGG